MENTKIDNFDPKEIESFKRVLKKINDVQQIISKSQPGRPEDYFQISRVISHKLNGLDDEIHKEKAVIDATVLVMNPLCDDGFYSRGLLRKDECNSVRACCNTNDEEYIIREEVNLLNEGLCSKIKGESIDISKVIKEKSKKINSIINDILGEINSHQKNKK